MAESKFLQFQDKTGDGLNDKCDDIIDVVPGKKCPACVPNPNFITPNWRNKDSTEPWFNEKFCKYQISVQTNRRSILDIEEIYSDYRDEAIEGLIVGFNKADTEEARAAIEEALVNQAYDLDPRPLSYAKVLYSVPFDVFANLPGAETEDDENEEEEEQPESPIVVEMEADLMASRLIRVRKAFNLYSRFYRVYTAIEKGKIVFEESNKLYSIKQFSRYGDTGLFPVSTLAQLLTSLDGFLNDKGLNIFGIGKVAFGMDRVTKIEFKFSGKYELKRMRVWTLGCGGKPYVYKKKRLKPLVSGQAWKDPTAVAYFAQMNEIDQKLQAREAPQWLDVVTEFTYPKVYHTLKWPEEQATDSSASCITQKIAEEGSNLGQDLLDELFSIGDALAYQFNKDICSKTFDSFREKNIKMGVVIDPNDFDPKTGKLGRPVNLMTAATEQAFKQMSDDEQIFVMICSNFLSGFSGISIPGNEIVIENLFADGLDRLKICGLFDLVMEVMGCLLGGLSLEAALSGIIAAALRGMDIDNLGKFFIGLPPEKQAELEALVDRKLAEQSILKDPKDQAILDEGIATASKIKSGKLKYTAPWKRSPTNTSASPEGDPETLNKSKKASGYSAGTFSSIAEQTSRRTLAEQYDSKDDAENEISDSTIIETYIQGLIEVYKDDLLSVTDMLNKYPGAQMIAGLILALDCPRPPSLDVNVLDFIKDIDLPWCRTLKGLSLPKLSNPFAWIPKLSDLPWIIFQLLKIVLQKILMMIIIKIMIKICELLGSAICKALEALGSLAASAVGLLDNIPTFRNVVRDSICGEDTATDEEVDDTIADMFEKLGVGGAALADRDAMIAFAGDLSSAVTRSEMMNAFLGDMSPEMATAAYNLVQYEYPQFSEAFPTKASIGDFMANCGTLIPEDVKQSMRDFMSDLPADDDFPANPTLCATPDQLDKFKEIRCALLEGRATPEQCDTMFENLQGDLQDDLESLATVMQQGFVEPDAMGMPPLVSQPGCDDGLVPFESPEQQAAVSTSLAGNLRALKKDYAEDMVGNGGPFGEYGLLNMILCDTMGQPLTAHWLKSSINPAYVDFTTDTTEDSPSGDDQFLFFFSNPSQTELQRGNFPERVAEYLRQEMSNLETTVELNNSWQNSTSVTKTFEELGFVGLFGGVDIDRISMPDMGYNVSLRTNLGTESMKIVRNGRKAEQDIRLKFRDNNKGQRSLQGLGYVYGFDIDAYFGDLQSVGGTISNIGNAFEPLDTTRIDIKNRFNAKAAYRSDVRKIMTPIQWKEYIKNFITSEDEDSDTVDRLFEFVAIDNTFDEIDPRVYPTFANCFTSRSEYSPSTALLRDIINNTAISGEAPEPAAVQDHIGKVTSKLFENFKTEIANNTGSFMYGAKYDTLVEADADYGIVKDGEFILYEEAEIEDDDGEMRTIRNSDMVMGVSRDQHLRGDNARVYYLDPTTYGGSYTNPGVYIKPLQHEGYLGMVNIMFPEFSPCKPRNTDLVDFESIAKEISDTYNEIPEDQRLQADPDCVTELPYNRILTRSGKAGIQGLIRAACRIYGSAHYLKTYATFSVFKPDFEKVFSTIYAQYVVENMERSFKDAQGASWEFFNTFKDDEFWYAFLEQAVQTYGRLVDAGTIVDPPESVLQALFRINDAQEEYKYPRITDKRNDVAFANIIQETQAPYRFPFKTRGLRMYRDEKNFEAIQATEEDAKIVLKEFVLEELKFLSDKFLTNMAHAGIEPKINDLFYYILSNMTQGGETLDLDKKIVEEPIGLPTEGDEHYTAGGELSMPDGKEYVGYYHTHPDQDGNITYMVGEFHTSAAHETLTPFANKLIVPIGDINEYNSGVTYSTSEDRPFVIEKYISLNGVKMNPSVAIATIKSNDASLNISDVYPGDLELVYPPDQQGEPNTTVNPVGTAGNLGARYGLMFSVVISGVKYAIATTEMDMLDLTIAAAAPIEGNSKLLLCMINQLRDATETEYIINGVYAAKKVPSILAIYNDMGFLPSIGELTVPDSVSFPTLYGLFDGPTMPTFATKPGIKVTFPNAPENWDADYSNSNALWASYADRQVFTPFNLDWDDWDQTVLKSSKSRIKKLFKRYYYNRKFDPFNSDDESADFAALVVKNLKASMQPVKGARILPWFRRNKLRDNPFNANGELCKKPEI